MCQQQHLCHNIQYCELTDSNLQPFVSVPLTRVSSAHAFGVPCGTGSGPDSGSGRQRRALCTVYLRTRLVLLHRSIFTGGHGVWPSRWGFFLNSASCLCVVLTEVKRRRVFGPAPWPRWSSAGTSLKCCMLSQPLQGSLLGTINLYFCFAHSLFSTHYNVEVTSCFLLKPLSCRHDLYFYFL